MAGNKCEYLTITSKDRDPKSAKALAKKGVFISARVHPGGSNASWMMKGLIDYLTGPSLDAKYVAPIAFAFLVAPLTLTTHTPKSLFEAKQRRWK